METIIYSANIGGYDFFNEPKIYDKNARYILFTDNKYFRSKVWEICHIDFIDGSFDQRKKARFVKLQSNKILPKHDVSIWIDHNFTSKIEDTKKILQDLNFEEENIMLYKHRLRKCIYEESIQVVKQKKEKEELVNYQIEKYKSEGFPENFGLFETGFMIRKNNESVNTFNDLWWNEVNNLSGRDQLSQMYVSWKLGLNISPIQIGESVFSNPFTESNKHIYNLKF